jgi:3-hydroxyisobutyrate dehydrogenase
MVGADATVLDRLRPVFEPIGNPIPVGNVGAGHAVKALNNLLSATHLLSTAEAMAAGQRFGLDPGVMIDVLNRSSGQSRSTSSKWPAAESLPPTVDQTELARWVLGMSAPGDDRTGD